MNGKVLMVKDSGLKFGSQDRYVNILGCFRYKPNGNVYVIYSDVDTKYNVVYYGSGHLRQDVILCMQCRNVSEEEIIKEYIFKMTEKEVMDNFEIISLENVQGIEIIASTKLEVKSEILNKLVDILFPKIVVKDEVKEETQKKVSVNNGVNEVKKNNNKLIKILIIIMVIVFLGGGYYYLFGRTPDETIEKTITCIKKYQHDEFKARVEETNKYNFNINDQLIYVDSVVIYQFNKSDYQDFMLRGNYYKYLPSSDVEGSWDKDDDKYIFKVMMKNNVDVGYKEPDNYEEVLSYYKNKGYICEEEIVNK